MIALVIATHTILVGTLFSTDLKQIIESAPNYEAISFWFGWICNTFYMNILFLISGYLVPSSVHKRGVANYARQRLLRLGIPLIIATFLLNNITPLAGLLIPNSNVFGQRLQRSSTQQDWPTMVYFSPHNIEYNILLLGFHSKKAIYNRQFKIRTRLAIMADQRCNSWDTRGDHGLLFWILGWLKRLKS